MPRRRRLPLGLSPLRYVEFAYEEPSPEPQFLTNTSPRPRSLDLGGTDLIQTSDGHHDHDQQLQGPFDDHLENDPTSSNAIDIRRDSKFVEDIPDSEKSPEPTPTIGSPLVVSSDMGREPVGSNHQMLEDHNFGHIIQILQEVSIDSDDSEDSTHIEYAPSQEPAHRTLPVDRRIPSLELIWSRGRHDLGFTRIRLGLKKEEMKRPQDFKEAIISLHLSKEPLNLRSRRYGSEEEKEKKKPIPKYALHHDSLEEYWRSTGQNYKLWIPQVCRLWIPEYHDRGGQRSNQPPCPTNLLENDSRGYEYFLKLDKLKGWVGMQIQPPPTLHLRTTVVAPDFIRIMTTETKSYFFLFGDERSDNDLNVDTNANSLFRLRAPSYSDVLVDFFTPMVVASHSDNDYLIDPRNAFFYLARPPLFPLPEDDVSEDHAPEDNASGNHPSGNNVPGNDGHILARNFPVYPSEDDLLDNNSHSIRRFNLPKMPGAYPSSSPEPLSEDEDLEALIEMGIPQSLPVIEVPPSLQEDEAPRFVSDKDIHMDSDNDAQSDGPRSPPRRPQYVYRGDETTRRPVAREYEFILDLARGITDANKPDSSKRLSSVARSQNDTTEDHRARKRRRIEIIRDDGSSDEDWDAHGEPRKILRLHLSEVTKKGKTWEPLTDEKAKELMTRGRAENYDSVSWKRSGHHNGSGAIQPEKKATSPSIRPGITRGQPMSMDEGVDMDISETGMKVLPQEISVSDLRGLHYRANVICNWLASNKWAHGSGNTPKERGMKREMQEIRDKAVSAKPLAKEDDRHRAALMIKDIIESNLYVNGAGKNNPTDDSAWFDDEDYDYDTSYVVAEMELNQLAAEIDKLPEGCKEIEKKRDRFLELEAHKAWIENRSTFYNDEEMDDQVWDDACDHGKLHGRLVPGDSRLNAEYGSAIAKWQYPATDEDAELNHILELSKATFEEDNIQRSVEAMNQGPEHSAALPPTKKVLPSIDKWQDNSMDEKALLQKAIAMSLAESRREDPELYDEDC
ncbi:hypothetical protein EAF04_007108 [Stromatinia cepivora]|nr:hypothetical protein EAF04_007108 [Stromatinia cepivora]